MRRIHFVFLVAAMVTLSCSSNTPTGDCTANTDCNSGEVCDNGDCIILCIADADCNAGEVCTDSLCIPGARLSPTVSQIDGDGANICPDADGSHCVAGGIVVQGENLEGASFELAAQTGTTHTLTPRANFTDSRVELDLPSNVGTGVHTLRAVNGSGSADQSFEFIQGPQGPAGADGSPDTAPQILAKLQTVDGTSSGLDADTLDGSELTDISAAIAAAAALAPPIGTIMAWHKDIDAGVPALPAGWMECNGQQVQDAESPIDYVFLPDLNGEIHAGTGRGTYLRGGLTSGVTNDSTTFGPNNSTSRYSTAGTAVYNGAAYHRITDADNTADALTYVNGPGAPVFSFQVAAMTVVWIIRVK